MREALIPLEFEGYVDVRLGSGMMVTTAKGGTPDCSDDEGPLEVLRVRSLVEGAIAEEVALGMEQQGHSRTRTDSPCDWKMGRQPTRVAADRQFHLYIAAKLDNKVLSQADHGIARPRRETVILSKPAKRCATTCKRRTIVGPPVLAASKKPALNEKLRRLSPPTRTALRHLLSFAPALQMIRADRPAIDCKPPREMLGPFF